MNRTHLRTLLLLILVLYLALGTLYAVETPAWQAPDEPAHYNYVRYLAENGRFPVLQAGDYPYDYLEQIKAAKFPPEMPIDGIRYESHQPPLYYALSAPVYQLFRHVPGPWATPAPGLLPLRLFSVLLGAGVIILAYAIARRIFPTWPALALASAAFVAFLPRHLASVAQAGNDTLAELLLAALLLVLVASGSWKLEARSPKLGARSPKLGARRWAAFLFSARGGDPLPRYSIDFFQPRAVKLDAGDDVDAVRGLSVPHASGEVTGSQATILPSGNSKFTHGLGVTLSRLAPSHPPQRVVSEGSRRAGRGRDASLEARRNRLGAAHPLSMTAMSLLAFARRLRWHAGLSMTGAGQIGNPCLPASSFQLPNLPGAESRVPYGEVEDHRPGLRTPSTTPTSPEPPASSFQLLASGVLLGLIAITKTTVYFALALILGVLAWRWWRERASLGRIVKDLALLALPAALLALPWYIRDLSVYGWPDFLGLRRHDAIVIGQLRLSEFLAQYGLLEYVRQLVVTTFQSFWAVFGWMGVYVDVRLYEALAVLCVVVAGGLILHERQARRPEALAPGQRYALRLLAATALLSLLTYAWYNLQFVQFQGRYLFSGLIPVALAFGLGWDGALRPTRNARLLAAFLVLLGLALAVGGLVLAHSLPKWPLALTGVAAAFLAVRPWLPRRLDGLLFALPYAVLPFLALYCLYGGIVPQLAR